MTSYLAQRIIHHTMSHEPRLNVVAQIGPGLVILTAHLDCASGTFQQHACSKAYNVNLTWAGSVDEAVLAALRERFVREEVLPARWNHFPELEGRDD